jgi:hypothetical protein
MIAYKFSSALKVGETCPNNYDYNQILKKYESGSYCNYGMDTLLRGAYIDYMGWRYVFHGKGELKRYLYLLADGTTGTAWAPNVKLLERNLHHKVMRAFKIS